MEVITQPFVALVLIGRSENLSVRWPPMAPMRLGETVQNVGFWDHLIGSPMAALGAERTSADDAAPTSDAPGDVTRILCRCRMGARQHSPNRLWAWRAFCRCHDFLPEDDCFQ
jgi:hypothetical protein